MRRMLAATVLATVLAVAAACGDDADEGNGTASNEEVCGTAEELSQELVADFDTAARSAVTAAAEGDAAKAEQAAEGLNEAAGRYGQALRDTAADAADPRLSSALEALAAEIEAVADDLANIDPTDPESVPDGAQIQQATVAIDEVCG